MTKSPAFQFYPDAFMGGKPGLMEPLETHVYLWLLCLDWNQNGFDFDAKTLAKWCRVSQVKFQKAWGTVSECFVVRDGRYYNERLERERLRQREWSEKSRRGGIKSAESRARVVEPPFEPKGNTPSLSPSVISTTPPNPPRAPRSVEPLDPGVDDVIAHYLTLHPKRRPSDSDRKLIARHLRSGYSVPDLKGALDGNAVDDWHRERKKHELAYVLKNNGLIDTFREKAVLPSRPPEPPRWLTDEEMGRWFPDCLREGAYRVVDPETHEPNALGSYLLRVPA
jgi:hypothetical protein